MKEKLNNFELKFYKAIGIKTFRKMVLKTVYAIYIPFYIMEKIPKEEWKETFHSTINYFMKKGNGSQDLKDFKKYLYLNSSIHIIAAMFNISSMLSGNFTVIPIFILNIYCILLQRYNYIRIDTTIKKLVKVEKRKIEKIKIELKEKNNQVKNLSYTIGRISEEKKETNIDELLNDASLEKLRKIKKLLNDVCNEDKIDNNSYISNNTMLLGEDKKIYCLTITKKS